MARRKINTNIVEIDLNDVKALDLFSEIGENYNEIFKNDKNMSVEFFDTPDECVDDQKELASQENWKPVVINIANVKAKKINEIDYKFTFSDINPFMEMSDGNEVYASAYSELDFLAYKFQDINKKRPRVYTFDQFNMDKFISTLFTTLDIPIYAYTKNMYQSTDSTRVNNMLIAFEKDVLMYVDGSDKGTLYYSPEYENQKNSVIYYLLSILKPYRRPKVAKNKIYIVYRTMHGFDKIGFSVNKLNVNIADNYNDDFEDVSKKIIDGLNNRNKTNLVILSGEPGTGKTTFIRYLTSHLKKNIIFISPDMVDSITDPAFIPFLMQNNDSVLIIEDAEPALEKRGSGGRSSAVSNVLNLTDGLLSDCLKISIVATFNTGAKDIDEALTRKGRLLMNYKFEKLGIDKSKKLLNDLGHKDVVVNKPMTLAEIYFYDTDNNFEKKNTGKIGF